MKIRYYYQFKRWVEQKKIQRRLNIFMVVWIILIAVVSIRMLKIDYPKILGIFMQEGLVNFLPTPTSTPAPTPTPDFKKEIITLTNNERRKIGLNSLTENKLLDEVAREKANDLINKNYWAHFPPNETEEYAWKFIKNSGYNYLYAGENLGKGFFDTNSQMSAWMASDEHKKNILDEHFTEIGVYAGKGVLQGENTIIMVQEFGTPQSDNYQGSAYQNQDLSINQIKSYRNDTVTVMNNWISARSRFPTDKIDQLVDSFNRQIAFSNQIISDYEKNGRFSNDNLSLWQAVIKMGNESSQLTNELNLR